MSNQVLIPDYAVFRCGYLLGWDDDSDQLYGNYDKLEIYDGVMVGLPYALCWPPFASWTWDWHRLLSEADYQALSFPPGWQTELYRGVVQAWTVAEAEALPAELLEKYREEAKRWIEEHVLAHLKEPG
jgi:hypothetical protein